MTEHFTSSVYQTPTKNETYPCHIKIWGRFRVTKSEKDKTNRHQYYSKEVEPIVNFFLETRINSPSLIKSSLKPELKVLDTIGDPRLYKHSTNHYGNKITAFEYNLCRIIHIRSHWLDNYHQNESWLTSRRYMRSTMCRFKPFIKIYLHNPLL